MIEMRGMQDEMFEWLKREFPMSLTLEAQTLGVAEETGEICQLILKKAQKIREAGLMDEEGWKLGLEDGVGDIIIYLMNLCSLAGIDIEEAIESTVSKVKKRDWNKWRENHGTE